MKILVGISASVAAYKSLSLIRLLKKQGHQVKTVLSKSAKKFITAQSLESLGAETRYKLFDKEAEKAMSHIELARWADIFIIAPATANTIGKMANGIADNLLTTIYLATGAKIVIAPAMNHLMLKHPATQENLLRLKNRPNHWIIEGEEGEQACGEVGKGRMAEPEAIMEFLNNFQKLKGLKITITAGATREPIDPVRFISNHSSGKMGFSLAQAALDLGATVNLISAFATVAPPQGANLIKVNTAVELLEEAEKYAQESDIFIAVAAVADYRPAQVFAEKQKKGMADLKNIALVENPDILKTIANLKKNRPFCVGFAAETENLELYAQKKLVEKNLDLIIANNVKDFPFGGENNQVLILGKNLKINSKILPKNELAKYLLEQIIKGLNNEIKF